MPRATKTASPWLLRADAPGDRDALIARRQWLVVQAKAQQEVKKAARR